MRRSARSARPGDTALVVLRMVVRWRLGPRLDLRNRLVCANTEIHARSSLCASVYHDELSYQSGVVKSRDFRETIRVAMIIFALGGPNFVASCI